MSQDSNLTVDAQLAVLNAKVDMLIELNKSRGEDHEARIRFVEHSYISKKAAWTLVLCVCTVVTAGTNFLAFVLR